MISYAVKRRVTTTMIYLGVVLLGIISLSRLPVQLLPDIEFPKLTIVTPYENAAPSEVEQLVSKYVEEAVSSVNGVSSVYSESIEGMSLVIARFEWGTNMDMALIETKEKVDIIKGQLPQDTGKSIVVKYDPKAEPIMIYSLAVKGEDFFKARMRVEKEILPYLERVDGVSVVDVSGGYKRQINVDLDNSKIYSHSLSLSEVIENVNFSNHNYPAGTIEKGNREYLVRTVGEFKNIGEISNVVVGRNEAGVPVYLRDVGTVTDNYKDKKCIIRLNGAEAIGLYIQKEPGKNTIETCKRVEEKVRSLQEKYKNDFVIKKVFDQSGFIRSSVNSVFESALLGGFIAFLVLWFFLKELRAPVVIITSIPVSIIATFALMYFKNITLNTMSLGGLAIGVGLMVDAAIVVLDSISEKRSAAVRLNKKGKIVDEVKLVIEAINDVKAVVIASVVTSIVVFLPIIFLSGLTGAIFGELALTISFSLIISIFSSLTLIPMLATVKIPKNKIMEKVAELIGPLQERMNRSSDAFMEGSLLIYQRVIRYSLANSKAIMIAGFGIIIAGILLFMFIDKEVMPKVDPGEFTIDIEAPRGTTLEESSSLCQRAENILLKKKYVKYLYAKIGSDPDDNIAEKTSGKGANWSSIKVILEKERGLGIRKIIAQLKSEILFGEGIKVNYRVREDVVESLLGNSSKPLVIEIYGKETAGLFAIGNKIRGKLSEIKGVHNIESALDLGDPELKINVDRNLMASLGVTISSIASSIKAAIYGEVATKYREKDDEIDIRVRISKTDRTEKDSLYKILVKTDTGATLPISKFVSIEEGLGASKILRSEQSKVNIITAEIAGNRDRVFSSVKDMLKTNRFDEGYEAKLVGENSEIEKTFNQMIFALLLAIVLVYMVMAAQFQSFVNPLIIMFSIPLASLGISLSLLLTGKTLNINSGIGIVLLTGTVVNHTIVLFDLIDLEIKRGKEIVEAIIEAGKKRIKPIFMTTATAMLGVLPIAFGIGEGAELQQSMAISIIGGLLESTFLTLCFIPTIYYMVNKNKTAAADR